MVKKGLACDAPSQTEAIRILSRSPPIVTAQAPEIFSCQKHSFRPKRHELFLRRAGILKEQSKRAVLTRSKYLWGDLR